MAGSAKDARAEIPADAEADEFESPLVEEDEDDLVIPLEAERAYW